MKIDEEDAVIQSKMLSKQVESAQKRVEGNNYDTRKNVLQYDDVMREQREVIYGQRQEVIMEEQDLSQTLMNMVKRSIERVVDSHTQLEDSNQRAEEVFEQKKAQLNSQEQLLEFEKVVILRVVDTKWTDHIDAMDQLRQSVGLRAYGQNNPLVEYQTEGYNMFEDMVGAIEYEVTRLFMKAEIRQNVQREQVAQGEAQETETVPEEDPSFKNVGRNDPCPCGSGKKFKNCHGKN